MSFPNLVASVLGLCALVATASPTRAEILRWNLQAVRFNDGAIANGHFDLDTGQSSGPITAFDIKVTGGHYPAFEYTPANADAFGAAIPFSTNGPPWVGASIGARSGGRSIALRSSSGELAQAGTHALTSYLTTPRLGAEADAGEFIPGEPGRWIRTGGFTTEAPREVTRGPLVQWTLEGVRFDNGGTATGSFVLDNSTGAIERFDLHSSMPCTFADVCGTTEDDINDFFPCQPTHSALGSSLCWGAYPFMVNGRPGIMFDNGGDTPGSNHELGLLASMALSSRGGRVTLSDKSFFSCCASAASGNLVAGALVGTPLPEPAINFFAATGLAILLLLRQRSAPRS